MRYMLLTYGDERAWNLTGAGDGPSWSDADVKAMIKFMQDEDEKLAESGELVYAEGLADPATAKTVRVVDGATVATDGPYLKSKELLAGFWVVDCESYDRAVAIAAGFSNCPGPGGQPLGAPIEVRPIGAAPEVG
jgi:hypothetical protein